MCTAAFYGKRAPIAGTRPKTQPSAKGDRKAAMAYMLGRSAAMQGATGKTTPPKATRKGIGAWSGTLAE